MRVFGLCGRKQSGKDTFADFATEALSADYKVCKRALADPLKKFCIDYLGLKQESCYGSDFEKNKWVSKWGEVFNSFLIERYDKTPEDPISGREVLQVVGTDVFRKCFRETFWLDLLLKTEIPSLQCAGYDVVFITDVRFKNELEGVRGIKGAKVIRVEREVKRKDQISHASETEMLKIPDTDFDYVIKPQNNRTLNDLRCSVSNVLRNEGLVGIP